MTRTAWVTGAAGGIGSAVVTKLLADGHRVAATDVDAAGLNGLEKQAGAGGDRLRCVALDVTDRAAVDACIAAVEEEWGPVHYGACVAGVIEMAAVADADPDTVRAIFDVNVLGVLHVLGALGGRMAERGEGSIVTVGSNAGMIPRVRMGAYGASKAAASMLTRTMGLELARSGVRCNVVCAGSTRTPMQARFQGEIGGDGPVVEGSLSDFRLGIPVGRIAEPEDVADAVLYLLSDRARHVTMTELVVDGGASLMS
ncbi:MAG: SDR family oxidoreductase [Gemmatimonadota bacterium]